MRTLTGILYESCLSNAVWCYERLGHFRACVVPALGSFSEILHWKLTFSKTFASVQFGTDENFCLGLFQSIFQSNFSKIIKKRYRLNITAYTRALSDSQI